MIAAGIVILELYILPLLVPFVNAGILLPCSSLVFNQPHINNKEPVSNLFFHTPNKSSIFIYYLH
jgi:hypothetical protein